MMEKLKRRDRCRSRVGGRRSVLSSIFIPVELAILLFFALTLTQG